ncbi:hypothetical protein RAC89_18160 [Paenibacillus sp. GD4]|uniref:hypothetical protein n=1 Tax=Paenibacillus sp. GD4 TaxID=3068890 RepID=UPI002796A1ED|nr:hypothetical protein [Paenibacillus sp. GD4]MDQ1912317.1 hypothetical protein [Paenibacillus sp. GD4]
MGIKDLFQEFRAIKERFDTRFAENKKRAEMLSAELRELKAKYDDRLYQEEAGGDIFTAEEQAELKKRIREIADEIEELEKRNNFNRRGRTQALIELIPAMKERAEKRRAELVKEHEAQAERVKRCLAEYLLAVKGLHDVEIEIKKANAEFTELAQEVGEKPGLATPPSISFYRYTTGGFRNGQMVPSVPYDGGEYGVLPQTVTDAYKDGKLPAWVNAYKGGN